ncbi:MAG: Crp/Fnr family transcriptional regulator [Bacteroidales bacterium]|nr:Crp/Fnr family transcriptional regulator [Bacteroidales bacterium]
MKEIIFESPVFKGIDHDVLQMFLERYPFQYKKYSKNEMIFQAGDPCNHLIIVLSGAVKGEMIDFSGKTIKIESITPPSVIAVSFIFGHDRKFPVNVIAVEETMLLLIEKLHLVSMFQEAPLLLENFLNLASSRAQFLSKKIKLLSFKTIKGKLAHMILSMAGDNLHTVQLPSSQKELAELFGITRPSLARALGSLEQEQLIKVNRREVTILDKEALIQYIL